jgi:hypothetical protein
MKTIQVFTICFLVAVFINIPFPSFVSACSCAEKVSVKEEFNRSTAVFSGKVAAIEDKRQWDGYTTKLVLFDVIETWKGIQQSQVIIATGQGGGDCGYDFQVGKEYLVYAKDSDMYGEKGLITTICDRTNEFVHSQDDVAILGQGQLPTEQVELSNKLTGKHFYYWLLALAVVGIGGLIGWKRYKKNHT